MSTMKLMRENRISCITKFFLAAFLLLAVGIAITNMLQGKVFHPWVFLAVTAGFVMFSIAKISMLKQGRLFNFGSGLMTPAMANLYRLGYWLIVVGLLLAFT